MVKNKEVIKMNMYQKRKIRAEKKNNIQEEKLTKVGINWYIPTLVNFQVNLDFISLFI